MTQPTCAEVSEVDEQISIYVRSNPMVQFENIFIIYQMSVDH